MNVGVSANCHFESPISISLETIHWFYLCSLLIELIHRYIIMSLTHNLMGFKICQKMYVCISYLPIYLV